MIARVETHFKAKWEKGSVEKESLWTLASEGLGIRCQFFPLKSHSSYVRLTSLGLNFLIPNNESDIYLAMLLWGGLASCTINNSGPGAPGWLS